jgi:hypothetical protein
MVTIKNLKAEYVLNDPSSRSRIQVPGRIVLVTIANYFTLGHFRGKMFPFTLSPETHM